MTLGSFASAASIGIIIASSAFASMVKMVSQHQDEQSTERLSLNAAVQVGTLLTTSMLLWCLIIMVVKGGQSAGRTSSHLFFATVCGHFSAYLGYFGRDKKNSIQWTQGGMTLAALAGLTILLATVVMNDGTEGQDPDRYMRQMAVVCFLLPFALVIKDVIGNIQFPRFHRRTNGL